MNRLDYRPFYRRFLPHLQPGGTTLFVTFRLTGSLPSTAMQTLLSESERRRAELARLPDTPERARRAYEEERRLFGRWDTLLDLVQEGPAWLRDPQVAALVVKSLHHLDRHLYDLAAFCVMPNHVHALFTPLPKQEGEYQALSRIMHSLKSYTAGRASRLLGREGTFWQHESYDHYVRDPAELERIVAYMLNNPVKAGLVTDWKAWPWSYVKAL